MTVKNECMCGVCPLLTECPKDSEWHDCRLNAALIYQSQSESLAELGSVLLFMAAQKVGFKRLDEATIDQWTERYRAHTKTSDSSTSPPELHQAD